MSKFKHILFWSEYRDLIDSHCSLWRNRKIKLSPFHRLSLASHVKLNNDTILLSYQKFEDGEIPDGIDVRDASEIFPSHEAYRALISGHSIAHISDSVRLKAATFTCGVVLDMDAVLLRELPSDHEGWFASMPAKRTGGFAPKWGKAHPPLAVHDKSWDGKALGAFPVKISPSMRHDVTSLSHKIMHTLLKTPKHDSKAWNYVIWTLKDIMKKHTKRHVYPPIAFCPIPAWLGSGKCYSLESPTRLTGETELFGYQLPSISEILEKSYIVQHFMESAFNSSSQVGPNFWDTIPGDCLIAQEAEFVLGNNWRSILS